MTALVPTLCVGTQTLPLCGVSGWAAERPNVRAHAEHGYEEVPA